MFGAALSLLAAATSALSVISVRKYAAASNAFNISLVISLSGMAILWLPALLLTDKGEISVSGCLLFALSGLLSPAIVRLLYYSGLRRLGAPVNASLFSVYPIYSTLLGVSLLNERLSMKNWVGIMAVILGSILVAATAPKNGSNSAFSKKYLLLPLVGGVALAVSNIIRKYALTLFNEPAFGVTIAYASSLFAYSLVLAGHNSTRKELSIKRDLQLFWKAGVGQAISWILIFYALSCEQVSTVTSLLVTEPLFVAIFAYLYLRKLDNVSPKLIMGIILIVCGVALIMGLL
ncbi:MAG: DMT family transporter [Candidatus Bathyarchaeota archaeon]|nr:DMT family transporter [Candidatus Bathyarchaeota archaeon]